MNNLKRNIKIYSAGIMTVIYFLTNVTPLLANDAQPIQQDATGQFVPVVDPDQQHYDRNFGEQIGEIPASDKFEQTGPLTPAETVEVAKLPEICEKYPLYNSEENQVDSTLPVQESPAVTAVKDILFKDLMKTFGFNEQALKDLIASGKIQITVDLDKLKVSVLIDSSVTLPKGAVNLFDPLGANKLPGEIRYTLGKNSMPMIICAPDTECKPRTQTYHLDSATFQINNQFYELSYIESGLSKTPEAIFTGDNRLLSVKVYKLSFEKCMALGCTGPANPNVYTDAHGKELIKSISFDYQDSKNITAYVVYQNGYSDGIAARSIKFESIGEGVFRISEIKEFAADGSLLVKNEFTYAPVACDPSIEICPMMSSPSPAGSLIRIVRTDSNGELLSTLEILQLQTSSGATQANILLPGGTSTIVTYGSIDELVRKAAQVEELENLFAAAFASLAELSGKETFTLEDMRKILENQALLKKKIEAFEDSKKNVWIEKFNQHLNQSDQILSSKPLKVILTDGREIIVRNPTDLMTQIIQRFKLMDQTGTIDLTRLAGIDSADVAGLQSFQAYLAARRIGSALSIPLFDLYSPYGNLELIDRLVRKYADSAIARVEGPVTVVQEDFLRYIDGTKPIFDAAMQLAKTIFSNYSVQMPGNPLTLESLRRVFAQLGALNQQLSEAMTSLINGFTGEAVFKNILIADIQNAVMNNNQIFSTTYSQIWQSLMLVLNTSDVVYYVNGQAVRVSRAELDAFTNGLPSDSTNLFRYPGVQADMNRDFLSGLFSQNDFNALSGIRLQAGSATSPGTVYFSYPARRFELLEQFLKTWSEAINANGTVNFDRLRLRLLISSVLERELNLADQYLQDKIAEMHVFASKPNFSSEDYAAMKALLKLVQEELAARFTPFLADVIYDTTNEVTARIQARYQALVNEFSSVLGTVSIHVPMPDGSVLIVNPREVNAQVLQQILNATAIAVYGNFIRGAYDRLNGIDAEVLAGLLSPETLARLKNFSFNNYSSSWQSQNIALEEILFNLIPALIQKAGTAETAGLTAYLIQGIQLPVPIGQSLEATVTALIQNLSQTALSALRAQPLNSIEDLLALRDIFKNYHADLSAQLNALKDFLSPEDQSRIEMFVNAAWYYSGIPSPNMATVLNEFNARVGSVNFLEINGVQVPIRQILEIPGFPWSQDFDAELFPNLAAGDTVNTETWAAANQYQSFRFAGGQSGDGTNLSAFGRIELIANIIRRLSANGTVTDKIFFTNSAGNREVNPEEFRRHIKDVDGMQRALIAQAQALIQAAAAELERMRKGTYTIEEIEAMHAKVLALRTQLIELLNQKASIHERRDVIEVENAISQIYQSQVFDLFVTIVGAATLTVEINGQNIQVPAKAITDALIAYLRTQLGDSIAAHSFATLFGIGVDDIRNAHKLENYLGEQIVALPRNSEYVQIVSQLSELGYMQLAVILIKRYAADIIKAGGTVDVPRLVQLLTDKDRAVALVKQSARDILAAKLQELLAAGGNPLNLAGLTKMMSIMNDAKAEWVSLMNDFLSGNSDDVLKTELENFVNALNDQLKMSRDGILETTPFVYEVDGRQVSILLNHATIGRFTAALASWIAANPGNPVIQTVQPVIDYFKDMNSYERIDLESKLDYVKVYPEIEQTMSIWLPYPRDNGYDPATHPTEFGLALLFARLAVKYGEFAVDADGFDMDLFIHELQTTDQSRAERRLEAILTRELPAIRNAIDALRDADGALPLSALAAINELFIALKNKVNALGQDAQNKAQEVWGKFMDLYEAALFESKLSTEINGQRVTFDPQQLNDLLMNLYREGKLDPVLMAKFDAMIKGGEDTWEYDSFKTLSYYKRWFEESFGRIQYDFPAIQVDPSDPVIQDGGFTLGDLARLPGISAGDLSGLDVLEKDQHLKLSPADPLTLLGLLDMRSLAPGSGVDVGGLMNQASAKMMSSEVSFDKIIRWIPEKDPSLASKSFRFVAFELIPALLKEMGAQVIKNGTVNAANFGLVLQGQMPPVEILPEPEDKTPVNLTVVTSHVETVKNYSAAIELMEKIRQGLIAGVQHVRDDEEEKKKRKVQSIF